MRKITTVKHKNLTPAQRAREKNRLKKAELGLEISGGILGALLLAATGVGAAMEMSALAAGGATFTEILAGAASGAGAVAGSSVGVGAGIAAGASTAAASSINIGITQKNQMTKKQMAMDVLGIASFGLGAVAGAASSGMEAVNTARTAASIAEDQAGEVMATARMEAFPPEMRSAMYEKPTQISAKSTVSFAKYGESREFYEVGDETGSQERFETQRFETHSGEDEPVPEGYQIGRKNDKSTFLYKKGASREFWTARYQVGEKYAPKITQDSNFSGLQRLRQRRQLQDLADEMGWDTTYDPKWQSYEWENLNWIDQKLIISRKGDWYFDSLGRETLYERPSF